MIENNFKDYKSEFITFNNNLNIDLNLEPCYIDKKNKIIYSISIPCDKLLICKKILISEEKHFNLIPNKPGLYWITTNEPYNHCLNSGKNCPKKIDKDYNIIYNGSSCNIRSRIKEHLNRTDEKGGSGSQSGISVDILYNIDETKKVSHIKCLWGEKKKKPKYFINDYCDKISDKIDILNHIYFSKEEYDFINKNKIIYLKNGINIFSNKHKNYNYIIYYLEIDDNNIRNYIEIEWRNRFGIPQLCSYNAGR
jgi:hypothetical protein